MTSWAVQKGNQMIESLIARFQSGEIDEQEIEQGFDDLGVESSDIPALKGSEPKRREWTNLGKRLISEHVFNATNLGRRFDD